MGRHYLLDTNAYYLFFQKDKREELNRLSEKLRFGENICFSISEISSLEIHSVLGKYRRGIQCQVQQCKRTIISDGASSPCLNTWTTKERAKLNLKTFRGIQKMVSDIESKNGIIQADVLCLEQKSITIGTKLLIDYADRYNFGSHDALIAGSVINSRRNKKLDMILVTSDKALKAVMESENIPFYDPMQQSKHSQ